MEDWPDDDNDGDYSREDSPPSATLAVDTRPDAGHIKQGKASPSDTCQHTCIIFNQNVNGLGGRRNDKLEKLIVMMIEQQIHAYCVQETWQMQDYMLTIRGHTVFHHGIKNKPQQLGRISAGVMIILGPDLTQAWDRAGKLKPLTSSPTSRYPGRMIGVTLGFPNFSNRPGDTYHRKAKGWIKIFLCSVYHPYDADEQLEFYDELDQFITRRPRKSEILIGADVNCNAGTRTPRFSDVLGPHGINNRNYKGRALLYLYKTNNLKILLTYFKHNNYTTYRSFSAAKSVHMLDNFISCPRLFRRVSDCKVNTVGVCSDHAAIQVKFRLTAIKFNTTQNDKEIIDWQKIQMGDDTNKEFNKRLFNYNQVSYTEFNSNILLAAKAMATRKKSDNHGWFHHSEHVLLPAISHRDHLLHLLRNTDSPAEMAVFQVYLTAAQPVVTDNISLAKAAWSAFQANKIHNMRFTPKTALESVKVLAGGLTSHHKAPTVMRLKLPCGKLASTDAENASVMGPHFEAVYTNHRKVAWRALAAILQRAEIIELDSVITWGELKQAVAKLKNGKSPGLNDVPPDAFKSLTSGNLATLLDHLNSFWNEEVDFEEWHEGQVVPVPKSGNLSDPNKWRGVTLMDLGSKIFSSIMCTRLFKIIVAHGDRYQFGSTPGVGCQDGSFTLKTILHLRHNHNLPTWVMFSDLVKAFDTSNHILMIKILKKYGCPPKLCSAIRRMYENNKVRLIIG